MKRLAIAAALGTLFAVPAAAEEQNLIWYYFHDDQAPSAFLAVVAEGEEDSPEPHYPLLLTCSLDDEWNMIVSDVDPKVLGTTIANGEQPTFALVTDKDKSAEDSGEYFPVISFSEMEGLWEYSSIWDLGALDHLVAAETVSIKGTGIERALPQKALKETVTQFKAFCEHLDSMTPANEGDDEAPADDANGGDDDSGDDTGQ
jgi:hypothetical protein